MLAGLNPIAGIDGEQPAKSAKPAVRPRSALGHQGDADPSFSRRWPMRQSPAATRWPRSLRHVQMARYLGAIVAAHRPPRWQEGRAGTDDRRRDPGLLYGGACWHGVRKTQEAAIRSGCEAGRSGCHDRVRSGPGAHGRHAARQHSAEPGGPAARHPPRLIDASEFKEYIYVIEGIFEKLKAVSSVEVQGAG